jgi:hypothetical protein
MEQVNHLESDLSLCERTLCEHTQHRMYLWENSMHQIIYYICK